MLISWFVRKTSPLTSIILGVAVTVISFFIYLMGASGWVVVAAILVLQGEPDSQQRHVYQAPARGYARNAQQGHA